MEYTFTVTLFYVVFQKNEEFNKHVQQNEDTQESFTNTEPANPDINRADHATQSDVQGDQDGDTLKESQGVTKSNINTRDSSLREESVFNGVEKLSTHVNPSDTPVQPEVPSGKVMQPTLSTTENIKERQEEQKTNAQVDNVEQHVQVVNNQKPLQNQERKTDTLEVTVNVEESPSEKEKGSKRDSSDGGQDKDDTSNYRDIIREVEEAAAAEAFVPTQKEKESQTLDPASRQSGESDELDNSQLGPQEKTSGFLDPDNFPDPIDFTVLDERKVEKIIRRRVSDTERHTFIVFKPDEQAQLKLETYKQKVEDGKIELEYDEHFETVPELITHKHLMTDYIDKMVDGRTLSQKTLDIDSEAEPEEDEVNTEQGEDTSTGENQGK